MAELIRQVAARSLDPGLFVVGMTLIYATGIVLLAAAALKFLEHSRNPQPLATSRAHFFSTREMLVGVLVLFPFWLNSIAQLPLERRLQPVYFAVGAAMVCLATAWHIAAKVAIRRMWSDGIEIKQEHKLVTTGAYSLSRHPMYAALLLWSWGASVLMFNWATLAVTTFVLVPLMMRRAKDEERALLKAEPEYDLYRQNAPMLTPKLTGAWGLAVRVAAVCVFAWSVIVGLSLSGLVLLCALHLYLGFCLEPGKVAFSYRSKSGLMVLFWTLSQLWHPAYYVLYAILAMFVYGLKFDCPCMLVYEKYHGCPCFRWARSCLVRPHP